MGDFLTAPLRAAVDLLGTKDRHLNRRVSVDEWNDVLIAAIQSIDDTSVAAEPPLGNPDLNGLYLKSDMDGTRSWDFARDSRFQDPSGPGQMIVSLQSKFSGPIWTVMPGPASLSFLSNDGTSISWQELFLDDFIAPTNGAIIYADGTLGPPTWVILAPGNPGEVLTLSYATGVPVWLPTQLYRRITVSGENEGSFLVQDATPTTGNTQFIIKESATQTSGSLYVQDSAGNNLLYVHPSWALGYTAVQQLKWAPNTDGGFALNTLGLYFAADSQVVGLRFRASSYAATDLELVRTAAGILEQRAGTQAQESRFYKTYTDDLNYERLAIRWGAYGCEFRVENAGTGVQNHLMLAAGAGANAYILGSAVYLSDVYTAQWDGGWSPRWMTNADAVADLGLKTNRWKDLFTSGRSYLGALPSAPADADLVNSTLSFYLDEGTNDLKVRVRYSDGTLKTATVALA